MAGEEQSGCLARVSVNTVVVLPSSASESVAAMPV